MTKEDAKTSSFFVENNFRQKDIKTEKTDEKENPQSFEIAGFQCLGEKIRTSGLLNPIQARYQTAPHPDNKVKQRIRQHMNNITSIKDCQSLIRLITLQCRESAEQYIE